jgi:hypothetical protein
MDVMTTGVSEITISGHIKSIEDYQAVKVAIKNLTDKGQDTITIKIPDSLSMTSSIIGFLLKLIYVDKVKISMFVKDERLLGLLDILNLTTVFNVTKMK